jgi:hypothetical protein
VCTKAHKQKTFKMALRLLASGAQGGSGALPALWRFSRAIGSSSAGQQAAQPQPISAEPEASPSSGVPRWERELGVVRNDWT